MALPELLLPPDQVHACRSAYPLPFAAQKASRKIANVLREGRVGGIEEVDFTMGVVDAIIELNDQLRYEHGWLNRGKPDSPDEWHDWIKEATGDIVQVVRVRNRPPTLFSPLFLFSRIPSPCLLLTNSGSRHLQRQRTWLRGHHRQVGRQRPRCGSSLLHGSHVARHGFRGPPRPRADSLGHCQPLPLSPCAR
ncbi:uncharacterized protein COLE_04532 [Cutaneotrichosporon oleaginosum]|nr:hypothetical protein COLE_04532 [Cutaneotrichosporon oleaginosum]